MNVQIQKVASLDPRVDLQVSEALHHADEVSHCKPIHEGHALLHAILRLDNSDCMGLGFLDQTLL